MAGLLWTRWLTGLCSSERLRLGAVALGYGALSLQDWQEAADAQGQDLYPAFWVDRLQREMPRWPGALDH